MSLFFPFFNPEKNIGKKEINGPKNRGIEVFGTLDKTDKFLASSTCEAEVEMDNVNWTLGTIN